MIVHTSHITNFDIGLRILTPWYDGGMDDATLRMMSGQGKEVLVVLPTR